MQRNLNLIGTGSSGAKLILIGEHAVVYKNPAIAVPFNGVNTTISIFESKDEISIDCMYHKGYLKDGSQIIFGLEKLVFHILELFEVEPFGLHIKIDSNIISQRGLGSSASVSVAMVRALFNAFGKELTDDRLIELAMYAEKIHHTNPSGLDVYTLVYQKPIWYVKGEGFKIIDINFDGTIMILDSGMMSQTRIAVEHVAKLYENNNFEVKQSFDILKELTISALKSLEENDVLKLGNIMDHAQIQLEKIEVSNDTINNLIYNIKKFDVLGAKLTGGGMGGCVIALIDSVENAKKIKRKLIKIGLSHVWIYPLKELA